MRLRGTYTALVTPLSNNGDDLDLNALEALVEGQIAAGVTGLVPCGTTGETPTLSDDEQVAVIRRVVAVAKGRVPVVAGTGSFSTKKTIESSKAALAAGADGVMVVMPYYNKPSQDGMREHVLAVARAIQAPIVLYNIPGRSVVDLATETLARICDGAPNVTAIKDATGNVLRCQETKALLGDRLDVMCGDDGLTLAMMAVGAAGVISVTSNVRPKDVVAVTRAMEAGDVATARRMHMRLLELHAGMFLEPNPSPAKAVLAAENKASALVRLPLLPASERVRERLAAIVAKLDTESAR